MTDVVLDLVILAALTYGFVAFTAAIAGEFLGLAPLPWWAKAVAEQDLLHGRASTLDLTLLAGLLTYVRGRYGHGQR
jgi:hypothetical protein